NRFRRKILRNFPLPATARLTVMDKVVADLGRDDDFIPLFRKRLGDQFLAQTVSVGISRVEQRNTEIERLMHEPDRFALSEIPPPSGGNSPKTKPDFAHGQVGVSVGAETHSQSLNVQL